MLDGSLLLSIQPEYANRIFDGSKKVELRRMRPRLEQGDWVLVYVSGPVKALVGGFQVDRLVEANPRQLWNLVRDQAGVSRKQFESYYAGASKGYGILLATTEQFPDPNRVKESARTLGRLSSTPELSLFDPSANRPYSVSGEPNNHLRHA